MKVFEMIRHWEEHPLTVFARDIPEAEDIYRAWATAHFPDQLKAAVMVHTYEGKLLEARPALASAAALEIVVELAARSGEQVRTEAGVLAEVIAALHAREERLLHEILGALGHLVAEEPEHRVEVPIEQSVARLAIPRAPVVEQLEIRSGHGV